MQQTKYNIRQKVYLLNYSNGFELLCGEIIGVEVMLRGFVICTRYKIFVDAKPQLGEFYKDEDQLFPSKESLIKDLLDRCP